MKNLPDLFQLIKSLSMQEKRYFKLSCSVQKGNKNYLKLFDAIEKQSRQSGEYDERIIQQKESFKKLPNLKNYLYTLILKSLESYHANMNIDSGLKSYMHHAAILFEKGLYEQCKKVITKAKALAEKYEKHLLLLELSDFEFELIRAQSFKGKTENDMENWYAQRVRVNNKYSTEKEYERLSARMSMRIYKKGRTTRSDTDLSAYHDIINHRLLRTENNAMSYQSLYHYYRIQLAYFFALNDFTAVYSYSQKLIKLMEAHPHQIEEGLQLYVSALGNLITCQANLKKYKEVELSLKKLKEINTKSSYVKSQLFYITNNMNLIMCINTGEFDKGLNLIAPIQEELNKNTLSKHAEMPLLYNIFYIYFGAGNYREARNYLNKIINDTTTDVRSDLYCFVKIINLIVHFELGNENLLEYIVKSTYRFLYKRNRLYKFETSILNFIRKKLPHIKSDKELIMSLKELKKEIEEVTKVSFEAKALDYFDFISWLESKISNKLFAEIVKGKAHAA